MKQALILSIIMLLLGCYTQLYFQSVKTVPLYAMLGKRWLPKYKVITYQRNRNYRRQKLDKVEKVALQRGIIINVKPLVPRINNTRRKQAR